MVAERLPFLPPILSEFRPAPPASDRLAWGGLPDWVKTQILTDGAAALNEAYQPLLASDYQAYTRTGDRAEIQAKYFAPRRALDALIVAA